MFAAAEWSLIVEALRLSPQQARIVALILHQQGDKQIAFTLNLSMSTVRTHLSKVFTRLDVCDRVGVVCRVIEALRVSSAG